MEHYEYLTEIGQIKMVHEGRIRNTLWGCFSATYITCIIYLDEEFSFGTKNIFPEQSNSFFVMTNL